MTDGRAGGVLCALALLGTLAACDGDACRHIGPARYPRTNMADEDRQARVFARNQQSLRRAVRDFSVWHERLRAIDMAALGLPSLPPLVPLDSGVDAFRPVAHDTSFCERLPPGEMQSSSALVTEYRKRAETWLDTRSPQSWDDYRRHFLAERHLARLACTASMRGGEHVVVFLELLADDREGIRYVAAVHAVNHAMDVEAGYRALHRLMDGYEHFEVARQALESNGPPLRLGYAADDFRAEALFLLAPERPRPGRAGVRGAR